MLRDLRDQLLQVRPKGKGSGAWDRETAVQVLTAVGQLVHALMDNPLPPSLEDPDIKVSSVHISSQVLDELCISLQGLDHGKVDVRLKPDKGTRAHGIAMTRLKREALMCVDMVANKLQREGIADYEKRAREDVAGAFTDVGINWPEGKYGSRSFDAKLLDSWNKRPPK